MTLCDAPDQDQTLEHDYGAALVRGHAHPLLAHVLGGYALVAMAPGQDWAQRAEPGQELELWLVPEMARELY